MPTPPRAPESRVESMLEQLLQGQQKMTMDFSGRLDAMYTDLNGKIEALSTGHMMLETQIAQTVETVKGLMVHSQNEYDNETTEMRYTQE